MNLLANEGVEKCTAEKPQFKNTINDSTLNIISTKTC